MSTTGNSGSGKSRFDLFILRQLLSRQDYAGLILFDRHDQDDPAWVRGWIDYLRRERGQRTN